MKYRIFRALTCYRCGGDCYSVAWIPQEQPKGRAEVYWKCKECGRQFLTNEDVSKIATIVEKLPESPYYIYHEVLE